LPQSLNIDVMLLQVLLNTVFPQRRFDFRKVKWHVCSIMALGAECERQSKMLETEGSLIFPPRGSPRWFNGFCSTLLFVGILAGIRVAKGPDAKAYRLIF
jgi:hypothetical protein